jgi:hypothetical protein
LAKFVAEGYDVLNPGHYRLGVVDVTPVNEYGPQIKFTLRVVDGENKGFVFTDFANRGSENGVRVGTKSWDFFQACSNRRLAVSDVLDTADLIGKRFEARVLVRSSRKGNYCEHGSIVAYQPEKDEPEGEPESEKGFYFGADDPFDRAS